MARFDVTNAEWDLIEPFLPVAATGPLPRRARDQLNGMLWRFRTGSGWRDVPERYGPWSTIYTRFRAWALAGVFEHLMDGLIAEAASRGQVGLEFCEVLDALELALTEEKGVPLDQQVSVLRVMRAREIPLRVPRRTIRRARSAQRFADAEKPGPTPPDSAGHEAG